MRRRDGLGLGGRRKLAMFAGLVALLVLSALGAAVQSSARDAKRPSSAAAKRGRADGPQGLPRGARRAVADFANV